MSVFEQFATEFGAIVEEEPGQLTKDRELLSIPLWDSLAVVTVMAMVSEKFDVVLEPEKLAAATTVGDLFSLVESATAPA